MPLANASVTVSAETSKAIPAPYIATLTTPLANPLEAKLPNTAETRKPIVQPIDATAYAAPKPTIDQNVRVR